MIPDMTTTKDKQEQAKTIIAARVAPGTGEKLDTIAATMKPKPSRSQLVELAIEEFIERRVPKGKGKDKG
jgi:predicted transcriptional regulator